MSSSAQKPWRRRKRSQPRRAIISYPIILPSPSGLRIIRRTLRRHFRSPTTTTRNWEFIITFPFAKGCHFCYFRVYTDKNASEIKHYLDSTIQELKHFAKQPRIAGRKPHFVYFGGGTPSYLSGSQLTELTDKMKSILPWDEAEEVAFEGEP